MENRRLAARLKTAKLKQAACVEELDFRHPRALDKATLLSLAGCQWIRAHHNLIISGPTSRFLDMLAITRAYGSYASLVRKLAKTDLLLLDDWGLAPLAGDQARDMLDILEDRNQSGSTLIVTQIPVSEWHSRIADPTVADAILDRLFTMLTKLR